MKNTHIFALIGIFLLALFLRIYNLESLPYGFHFDEVKAGWNAYSILKTGMDDKGNKFPLYYDSFGDFRPMGIFYAIIPSLLIFGKSVFAVRFPAALIGALTIFPLFFILKELSPKNYKSLGLIAAILLALNPWHIVISRATSEAVISLFLAIFGIYFLIKTIKYNRWKDVFLSVLFFGISYFFYHSIKLLAPIFVMTVIFMDWSYIHLGKKYFKPLSVFIILVGLTLFSLNSSESRGRMSQVSLKSDFQVSYEIQKMPAEEGPNNVFIARSFHNKPASYLRRLMEEYKNYFGTEFLLGDSSRPIRYTVPYIGLLTYFDFAFLILGLATLLKHKEIGLFGILLLLAPIPAAVTNEDTPNLHRAMFMIPFLIMIETYGVYFLFKTKKWVKFVTVFFVIGYVGNFVYFYHMYTIHQKFSLASYYRDGGNVELSQTLNKIKNNYDRIVLTNYPDNLLIWVAFFGDVNPKDFNKNVVKNSSGYETFSKFIFSSQRCPANEEFLKKTKEKTLVVDAEGCELSDKLKLIKTIETVGVIKRPDGSPPYYLKVNNLKANF